MSVKAAWSAIREGRLGDAVAAVGEAIKANTKDAEARGLLVQLLVAEGDLPRADAQLDALARLDPTTGVGVALWRQLIRAEQNRRDFFEAGRVPELLDQPTEEVSLRLRASILLREGHEAEAKPLLEDADAKRPRPRITIDGQVASDFRDLDDLTASVLEVLTTNGKYYWIPIDRVEQLKIRPAVQFLDTLWRPAEMRVSGGPDGVVYLPTLYPGSHASPDASIRLGRATSWRGEPGPIRGTGLRMFLVGEEGKSIFEFERLERA